MCKTIIGAGMSMFIIIIIFFIIGSTSLVYCMLGRDSEVVMKGQRRFPDVAYCI
jgi:uncharacterized membrane protein